MTEAKPSVLFVCVKNAGKSQMAAALMRQTAGDAVAVHSAGTHPGTGLNDLSEQSVTEVGADMAGEYPKAIDPDVLRTVDRVVVIGDAAHVEPVAEMAGSIEVWPIDEPSARGVEGVERMRQIRDQLTGKVHELTEQLTN